MNAKTYLLIILSVLFLIGCGKDERIEIDPTTDSNVTYIFNPGETKAEYAYHSFYEGKLQGGKGLDKKIEIKDKVKGGDVVMLSINTSEVPNSDYSITLLLNGKEIKKVVKSGESNVLRLQYTVTASELNN